MQNLWDEPTAAPARIALQELLLDILVATENRAQVREAYW